MLLVALAECAIELLFVLGVLKSLGYDTDEPVRVFTDNKAAHDLCNRYTTAQNSRHIDRKMFKMRELRGAGVVTVDHVPTEDNPADLMTKVLGRQPFEKHRATVMNRAAAWQTAGRGKGMPKVSEDVGVAALARTPARLTREEWRSSVRVPRAYSDAARNGVQGQTAAY